MEERKDGTTELPAPLISVIKEKAQLETAAAASPKRKPEVTMPEPEPEVADKPDPEAVEAAQAIHQALVDHDAREKRSSKFHIARPWLKKKTLIQADSSDDELERLYGGLGDTGIRAKIEVVNQMEADRDLFPRGKVSEMKAKLNQMRALKAHNNSHERSDGITEEDDDDDVIY